MKDDQEKKMSDEIPFAESELVLKFGAKVKDSHHVQFWKHDEPKEAILQLDLSGVDRILERVAYDLKSNGNFQLCNLLFSGYDADPRDIYEIPEVRQWCKKALEKAPFLPLLLSEFTIQPFLLSVLDIDGVLRHESETREVRLSDKGIYLILSSGAIMAVPFFFKCGISDPLPLVQQSVERISCYPITKQAGESILQAFQTTIGLGARKT